MNAKTFTRRKTVQVHAKYSEAIAEDLGVSYLSDTNDRCGNLECDQEDLAAQIEE